MLVGEIRSQIDEDWRERIRLANEARRIGLEARGGKPPVIKRPWLLEQIRAESEQGGGPVVFGRPWLLKQIP